jgi:hypothetical protein
MRARWVGMSLALLLLLAGCAGVDPGRDAIQAGPSSAAAEEERASGFAGLEPPPPVRVHYSGRSVELRAWTFCYRNGCADGFPPKDPVDVGSPDEVRVEFPLPGWTFSASFAPAGIKCGREQTVDLELADDGGFILRPAGHPATYDVTLMGRGGGDLFVTFRWTTLQDGPLPEPTATLAVLAEHDGAVDSYGVELMLTNLAATPRQASAVITVREDGGGSVTFDAVRAKGGCWNEGTVYWDGPDERGRAAAALGDGPFTYQVEVTLDGVRHTATADWPKDELPDYGPSVALEFDPPLPALT